MIKYTTIPMCTRIHRLKGAANNADTFVEAVVKGWLVA